MSPSRRVMKSSLDLWDAVDRLRIASRDFLSPQESAKVDGTLVKRAKETLELLGDETKEDTSESSEDESQVITEVRILRSHLKKIAST